MTPSYISKSKPARKWLHAEFTAAILDAARDVHLALHNRAYSEENYREALARELRRRGHVVQTQVRYPRLFKAEVVGESIVDLVLADKVVVLIKTSSKISEEYFNLLKTYCADAHLSVGLVLAFNRLDFIFKRFDAPPTQKSGG